MKTVYMDYLLVGYRVMDSMAREIVIPEIFPKYLRANTEGRVNLPETLKYLNKKYGKEKFKLIADFSAKDFKTLEGFIREEVPKAQVMRGKYKELAAA